MKRIFTSLVLSILFISSAFAQNANAVFFSENGDKFTVYLNGEQRNPKPLANVKVTGLSADFYQLRVDFENAALTDIPSQNIAVAQDFETTYVIKVNKKGEYVCRGYGQIPMSDVSSSGGSIGDAKDYAIVDDEVQPQSTGTTQVSGTSTSVNSSGTGSSKVTEHTTTTTTVKPGTAGENVSMNMNVDGINMGVNVNVTGMDTQQTGSMTTTTTTTTTHSSSSSSVAEPVHHDTYEEVVVYEEARCARSMNSTEFSSAKSSISSKSFDDTKLTVAKQIIKNNCMTAAQIKDVLGVFGFEETKLDFAKFAYDYCYDQNNYYVVNDAFTFSSSIDELNQHIGQ